MTTHLKNPNSRRPKATEHPSLSFSQEWIDRAIPPGSSRYYAVLHADSETRNRLKAITALIGIWSGLAFNGPDPEITLRKVDWWRTELAEESYKHPLTQLLESALSSNENLGKQLLEVLGGYADLIQFGSPSTDEANKLFHWSTGAVACLALTGVENTVNNPVARAGVALSRFRCLRYLPDHVNARLLCLPLAALETNGLSPAQLQPGSKDPALTAFFQQQLQALGKEMEATAAELLRAGPSTRPLYIYLRSQQRLLEKILNNGADLMQSVRHMSPLRNYFIAFKAARQHYRYN